MRLWSIHPKYLDAKGLVALWREALLAQHVLLGKTQGYRHHPQLMRFAAEADPVAAIGCYLMCVAQEASSRDYAFDQTKILNGEPAVVMIKVMQGQVAYEWGHLLRKLESRAPDIYLAHRAVRRPQLHPLFRVVAGGIEAWERA
jgi:hypothetical protein